jgi:hypothetical protein
VPTNLLDRQFDAERPNQKWTADFSYIWTAEGWLCVAAVIDLFSLRAVGWSMSASITAQLVADALLMAVWRRGKPEALLHHSDQGTLMPGYGGHDRTPLFDHDTLSFRSWSGGDLDHSPADRGTDLLHFRRKAWSLALVNIERSVP